MMLIAPPLGILVLDTAFPRVRGDVGCADTFSFPVRLKMVECATVDRVVHQPSAPLLPAFIAAARELAAGGCVGIVTTCGYLARWQRDLAAALPVPVMTSALLQLPLLERTLPRGLRAGVVTYSAADLSPDLLAGAGARPDTPLAGVDPDSYFGRTIRDGASTLDPAHMAEDTIAAARRLLAAHADVGAVVLECANMPPYRDAVATAVGLPVYDAAQAIRWFYAGLTVGAPGRDNLW